MLKVSNFQQKNYSRQLNSNQNQSQPAFKAKLNGIDEFVAKIASEAHGAQPNLQQFAKGLRRISEALENIRCPDFHVTLHPGISVELGQDGNDAVSIISLSYVKALPDSTVRRVQDLMVDLDPKASGISHERLNIEV